MPLTLEKRCLECGLPESEAKRWYQKWTLCGLCYQRLYTQGALNAKRIGSPNPLPDDFPPASAMLIAEAVETRRYSCDTVCWEIPVSVRARTPDGYTRVWFQGARCRAHRIVNEAHYGPFTDARPIGMHRCDNPGCIRPIHLTRGTRADNSADMVAKGRQHKGKRVRSTAPAR